MLRKYALYLLLISSLVLAYFSGRMMMAGFWARQLNTFLLDWESKNVEPNPKAWQVAFYAANKAIALYPAANADYYDRLARVWEWKQFQHAFGDPSAHDSRLHALDAYRQSVVLRPLWPYTWGSLAYTKMRLLQIDAEFSEALRNAVRLGPWRLRSNQQVAEMGLITWPDLDDETRWLVLESIRRTVSSNTSAARWLEERAIQLNRHLIFCGVIDPEVKSRRNICKT